MNDADGFQEILGHRSGYVCGRGVDLKPTSSAVAAIQKDKDIERNRQVAETRRGADEARREADETRREANEARRENEIMNDRMDELNEKFEALSNLVTRQYNSS